MQKWEYKVLKITEELIGREFQNIQYLQGFLEDWGRDGWELINVIQANVSAKVSEDNEEHTELRYYFKRPII